MEYVILGAVCFPMMAILVWMTIQIRNSIVEHREIMEIYERIEKEIEESNIYRKEEQ